MFLYCRYGTFDHDPPKTKVRIKKQPDEDRDMQAKSVKSVSDNLNNNLEYIFKVDGFKAYSTAI